MTNISTPAHKRLEPPTDEEQAGGKLFESYINVTETIGTVFLGVLSFVLIVALQRSWKRYEELLKQTKDINTH